MYFSLLAEKDTANVYVSKRNINNDPQLQQLYTRGLTSVGIILSLPEFVAKPLKKA